MLRVVRAGATVWKARLQHERLGRVGAKGLADRVDLSLHVGHGPGIHALLEDAHMPRKVLASVHIEVGIRGGDGHLRLLLESPLSDEASSTPKKKK